SQALEHHAFAERQRQRPFTERETEETHKFECRLRLRQFVCNRAPANEVEIAALNLACWPGRSVARFFFTVAAQNPGDPLVHQFMTQCASALPVIWNGQERRRSTRSTGREDQERYDPQIEYEFVKGVCSFV